MGHPCRGADEAGVEGLIEEGAALSGDGGHAGSGELAGDGVLEDGVDPIDDMGRADAANGGEDERVEDAALVDAALQVAGVLLGHRPAATRSAADPPPPAKN